jgi:DNA helicase MCM9
MLADSGLLQTVLTKYYQVQRRSDNAAAPRTTVRLLESVIRLAQAHARLMCRREALLMDAIQAILCVETSLHSW